MRLAVSLVIFFCVSAASAHDYWGNGKEVDVATKSLCCGKNDCKEVDADAMSVRADGLVHFSDTPLTVPGLADHADARWTHLALHLGGRDQMSFCADAG